MRADVGTLVALNTFLAVPNRNIDGDSSLLVLGSAVRHGSVGKVGKVADRDVVALHLVHRNLNLANPLRQVLIHCFFRNLDVGPACGNLHLRYLLHALVHSGVVHVDNLFSLSSVGLQDRGLHVFHCLVDGDDSRNLKESGLEDGIGSASKPQFLGNGYGINGVKMNFLCRRRFLERGSQVLLQLLPLPVAGNEHVGPFPGIAQNIVLIQIGFIVAGHEIRMVDQVGGTDGLGSEPQMGTGHAAGLLSVVFKVSLHIQIGVVSDDFDGVLVGAYGTVRAKAPELAADCSLRHGVHLMAHRQGQMGHIIVDSYGEMVLRLLVLHIVVNRNDLGGGKVLGGQPEPSGVYLDSSSGFQNHGTYILVQRLARSSRLLGAVQNGDARYGLRKCAQEVFG